MINQKRSAVKILFEKYFEELIGYGYVGEEMLDLEEWLLMNIYKIKEFKNENTFRADEQPQQSRNLVDSFLIIDKHYTIVHYSGLFPNLYANSQRNEEKLILLNLVKESSLSMLIAAIDKATRQKCPVFFETSLSIDFGIQCAVHLSIEPYTDEDHLIVKMKNIYFPKNNRNKENFSHLSLLERLNGISIYLFDEDYRFLMASGRLNAFGNPDKACYIGKTFFEMLAFEEQKVVFPFFHQALQGINSEGKFRNKKKLFTIHAIPVKNKEGFTVGGIILIRDDGQNITIS